jgi:hypothetical protein
MFSGRSAFIFQETPNVCREYFRKLARRCRRLSQTAAEPEVIEQMRVWAVDFADEADKRSVKRSRANGWLKRSKTLRFK